MRPHSFLSKLLGRNRQPPVSVENLLTVVVTVRLNVRANAEDRSYYYGDPLDAVLAAKSLGEVTDGGTMFDVDTGRIDYVDVEIGLQESSDETLSLVVETLEGLGAPVGSVLNVVAEERKIHFGRFEGMSLFVDRANLTNPDDPSDEINTLLTGLEEAFGEVGAFRGYWEGQDACELYFYGPSFDAMRAKTAEFIALHPVLAHCQIKQIA
jgi:hypothetical protein